MATLRLRGGPLYAHHLCICRNSPAHGVDLPPPPPGKPCQSLRIEAIISGRICASHPHVCSIPVTKGQVVFILITGNEGDDYGPFTVSVDLAREGSSLATATFIGSDAKMEVSGSTQGYDQTYVNTRCNGNVTADGPDVVRTALPSPCRCVS